MCTKQGRKAEEFLDLRQHVETGHEHVKASKKGLGSDVTRIAPGAGVPDNAPPTGTGNNYC